MYRSPFIDSRPWRREGLSSSLTDCVIQAGNLAIPTHKQILLMQGFSPAVFCKLPYSKPLYFAVIQNNFNLLGYSFITPR